jgi:hypothetical protein
VAKIRVVEHAGLPQTGRRIEQLREREASAEGSRDPRGDVKGAQPPRNGLRIGVSAVPDVRKQTHLTVPRLVRSSPGSSVNRV